MKKILFLLSFLALICLSTYAADWMQTGNKVYLDKTSISKHDKIPSRNNVYSFWTKGLYLGSDLDKVLESKYGHKYWYTKTLVLIDCSSKESSAKSITFYDLQENPTYGSTAVRNDYSLEWKPIIPETVGEAEYNYVCGQSLENNTDNSYPSLDISFERIDEMRESWIYGCEKCAELSDTDPNFYDKYGHFYNCQGEYLEKFGKDFDKLYNYCTAGSMAKYTKCVENFLDIR